LRSGRDSKRLFIMLVLW